MKKLVVSHGMNAVNPCVRIIRTLKKSPYQLNQGCQRALKGRSSREMPWAWQALMKARWDALMHAHAIKLLASKKPTTTD